MKRQFLFNIGLLVLLNAIIKPFWVFGIDRTVQNVVGAAEYGWYFSLVSFSMLFNVILDPGLNNFNNKSIARHPTLIGTQFSRVFLLKLFLGAVYFLLCIGFSVFTGYPHESVKLLGVLALNQFLSSMLVFFRSNISGLQFFKTDSILSVLDRFLMIVLCALVLWGNIFSIQMDVFVFALAQTLAYVVACLTAFGVLLGKSSVKIEFQGMFKGEILRRSYPFALLTLLMVVYTRIDVILIEQLLPDGPKAAGIYAQSYRIYDAVNMVSVLFSALLLPMFARSIAEKKDVRPLIASAFPILITGVLIISVVLVTYSESLLQLLYTEFYSESPKTFVLLMISIIPVSVTYIFGTLLTAGGQLMKLNVIAIIALGINVLLNIMLIPHLGVAGAAASALVTQVLVASLQFRICKKTFKLSVTQSEVLRYFLLIFLVTGIAVLIQKFPGGILYKIFLSAIVSFAISFLLKIINLRDIRHAFRSESQY